MLLFKITVSICNAGNFIISHSSGIIDFLKGDKMLIFLL